MSDKRFAGKGVLIAGSASGIGLATAKLFAAEGAGVFMADVNPKVGDGFADIKARHAGIKGGSAVFDITKLDDCKKVVEKAKAALGRVDILACIAGVNQGAMAVEDLPEKEWDRIMNINLKGPYLLSKALVPSLKDGKGGRIITIGSYWGREPHGFFAAYCSSKAGLIMFTEVLSDEMAEYGVTVNCVCPGMINTKMHTDALEEEAKKRGITFEQMRDIEWSKIPLKRAGDPEEIGRAVLFLASDEASYMTGAALDVNGGVYRH